MASVRDTGTRFSNSSTGLCRSGKGQSAGPLRSLGSGKGPPGLLGVGGFRWRGDEITMTRCPYASLVGEFPTICDIHGALLNGILRESGQPIEVASLDVWAREDMCVARLRREDLRPLRTIQGSDLLGVTPAEGATS